MVKFKEKKKPYKPFSAEKIKVHVIKEWLGQM